MISGPWELSNFLTFTVLFVLSSIFLAKKIHWSVGLAFFCNLLQSSFAANGTIYNSPKVEYVIYLQSLAGFSIAYAAICIFAAQAFDPIKSLKALAWLNVANALWVVGHFLKTHDGFNSGGILFNSSMNSAFIALTLPFTPFWLWPLGVAAVFCAKASIPLGVLAAVTLATLLTKRGAWKVYLPALTSCLVLGYFYIPDLFDSSGRFAQWRASMEYWQHSVNHWLGAGAGTYYFLGSLISKDRGLRDDQMFTFMHGDWLQVLFEGGWPGLISLIIMFGFMLYYTRAKPALFSSITGFAVFALFNMPCRYMLSAFAGACLVRAAFNRYKECSRLAHL